MREEQDLDRPIWGAQAIGREGGIFKKHKKTGKLVRDKNGEPEVDVRKAFYLLETGAIAARQVKGRDKETKKEKERGQWVSTPRLIRNSLIPEAVA